MIDDNFIEILDDLRKLNSVYVKECEYISLYPRADTSKAKIHGEAIKDICHSCGIRAQFYKPHHSISNKAFTRYLIKGIDITKLIQP